MKKFFFIHSAYSLLLILNGCVAAYLVSKPPIYVLHLTGTIFFEIGPSLSIKNARWLIVFGLVVASCASLLLSLIRKKEKYTIKNDHVRWLLDCIAPLSLLPLACIPLLVADKLTAFWSTNAPLFLVLALTASILARLFSPLLDSHAIRKEASTVWAVCIFVFFSTGYAVGGFYFSSTVGEHVGDEGHYLIQAQSLYEDGDLDINNNIIKSLGNPDPSAVNRGQYHIAANSKDGAWYSWHPYGLSLLLAPLWPFGLGTRHFVLGVISGSGLAGLFLLCRRIGAGNMASLLAVLSLGTSVYWSVYSFRALPEVLGGTLVVWAFWAIAVQRHRPWLSLGVAAACCTFMPFAQTRFIPMSLMGIGLYGLLGLLGRESLRPKLVRLSIFTLICFLGYSLYISFQLSMFSGASSYPIKETLLSYPIGAWAAIAGDRGVVSIFPVYLWLLGSTVAWFAMDKKNRFFCMGICATFLACLLTSNTYSGYTGGSSMPGRYLVVVTPLLFVGAAMVMDRSEIVGRTWFFFLSLFSMMLLAAVLMNLEDIGRSFIFPIHELSSFPQLQSLYFPHAAISNEFATPAIFTSIYVGAALLISALILLYQPRNIFFSISGLAIVVFLGIQAATFREEIKTRYYTYFRALPFENARYMQLVDPLNKRPPWEAQFDVAKFHAFTGEMVGGEGDDDDTIRIARQDSHASGMFAFGRFRYVFPGSYSASYDLKLNAGVKDHPVATLDVASEDGRNILAQIDVGELPYSGLILLPFNVSDFRSVEPRIFYHATGNIDFRGLTLRERIPEGMQHLPALSFQRVPMDLVRYIFPYYLEQFDTVARPFSIENDTQTAYHDRNAPDDE